MVWAKLWFAGHAVVPDHPCAGAAVVVLAADPAATAVVVLAAKDQAAAVLILIAIATHDLAAGYLFGREVGLCANHRSPPSPVPFCTFGHPRTTGSSGRSTPK